MCHCTCVHVHGFVIVLFENRLFAHDRVLHVCVYHVYICSSLISSLSELMLHSSECFNSPFSCVSQHEWCFFVYSISFTQSLDKDTHKT